ncbi:MAG: hypothetical protein ABL886_14890 [Rhodoglobus sp.]
MEFIEMPAALAVIVWLGAFSLQLADLGTAKFDSRRLARGARTLVRLHPVTWVVPLGAASIVGLGFGIEYAQRLLFDDGRPIQALIVGFVLVVAVVAGWMLVTTAAMSPAADSYRAIRDELVELHGSRVQQSWLDGLRSRLDAIDESTRRTPAAPVLSWRSAARWTFRRPQRVVPVLAALVMFILLSVDTVGASGREWMPVLSGIAVLLSGTLSVLGARASIVLLTAVRETQLVYRSEAEQLLVEAGRSSRKPVAGLGDRVTRALQILREQQG